jgi:hypothetical protein
VIQEPLLVALKRTARCRLCLLVERAFGACNVGGFEGSRQVLMDDLECAGIGIVNADLLWRQGMLQNIDLDAFVGQGARGVEAKGFQIAGEHLHGGDAAGLKRLNKIRPSRKRKIRAAPKTKPLRIAEILHRCGAGGGNVDDAGLRQGMLEAQSGKALLRGRLLAAGAGASCGIGHGVGFIEQDHAVEIGAEPVEDLLETGVFAAAVGTAQRGVGGEEYALPQLDRLPLLGAG